MWVLPRDGATQLRFVELKRARVCKPQARNYGLLHLTTAARCDGLKHPIDAGFLLSQGSMTLAISLPSSRSSNTARIEEPSCALSSLPWLRA
jgi:hypothetical protein